MALKELWDVEAPRSGPGVDTEQGKTFVAEFIAQMEKVNPSLQFTAGQAEPAEHQPLADRRDDLVTQFHKALEEIDPADPSKAQPGIDQALSGAEQLGVDAAELKTQTEQALQAWQAQEPRFEQASDQVDELQDWESPEAPGFVEQVSAVRGHVDERRYQEACSGCEQLLAGLGPAYERYLEQKAAQARYEAALAELEPRLLDAQQCEFQSMLPLQQELDALQAQMKVAADARDFVAAEPMLADLSSKVDSCLQKSDALAARRAEYEQIWAALVPRLPAADESGGETVQGLVQQITAAADEASAAAAADDFDAAIQRADALESPLAELVSLREQRDRFEAEWALVEPKLPQTSSASPALAAIQAELEDLRQQTDAAAAAGDYEAALALLPSLERSAAEFQVALAELEEQRQAYEAARAALEPRLPTTNESSTGRLAELEDQVQQLLAGADAAAQAEDFEPALQQLGELDAPLAALATLLAQRDDYAARLAELEPRLPAGQEPGSGRLAQVQEEIAQHLANASAAAEAGDYGSAMQALAEAERCLQEYEELVELRDRFELAWEALEPLPPQTGESSPAEIEIQQAIFDACERTSVAATAGDYEAALCELEEIRRLQQALNDAQQAVQEQRLAFEQELQALQSGLDAALQTPAVVPEVLSAQNALRAKVQEMEAAAAAHDHETALFILADVQQALQAYESEVASEPRDCFWILATIDLLQDKIQTQYLDASNRVLAAAQAYDDALKEHRSAIAAVDAKKQLAADIVAGVFFAALGGAAGGAVGAVAKTRLTNEMSKAFAEAASGGAIIDATKDVAKFTTRFIDQFRGEAGDPTAVMASIGSSGVELGRGVGQAINEQGILLRDETSKLALLVRNNSQACLDGEMLRVEGDPALAIESDPFLKVLGTIKDAKQQDFAEWLWAAWIDTWAYTIEEVCNQGLCNDVVADNVEGFFAWWGNLLPNIKDQTGTEFGLQARLDAARAVAAQKAAADNVFQ